MLRLENISKIYPTGEVLKDVTWKVKSGDCIGLVGANGAVYAFITLIKADYCSTSPTRCHDCPLKRCADSSHRTAGYQIKAIELRVKYNRAIYHLDFPHPKIVPSSNVANTSVLQFLVTEP